MSRLLLRGLGLSILLLLVKTSFGKLVNATIDDTFGDERTGQVPIYLPNGTWSNFVGEPCAVGTCFVRPDPSRVHNLSWHESTWSPTDPKGISAARKVELLFEGSAIYIFTILDNSIGIDVSSTNLAFYVDDQQSTPFQFTPNSGATDVYVYNSLVYSNQSLPNGAHNVTIVSGGGVGSLLLFDYAIYTYDDSIVTNQRTVLPSTPTSTDSTVDPSTSPATAANANQKSSSSLSPGAVAGIAIAGTALCLIAIVFALYVRRRRSQQRKPKGDSFLTMGRDTPLGHRIINPFMIPIRQPQTPLFEEVSPYN